MASSAGDGLLLVLRVVARVRLMNGPLHATSRNFLDQGRLLIFQRRMAIEADPDIVIPFPVGLEKRIVIRSSVDAAPPFIVDLSMTLPARFGSQAVKPRRDRLIG